jgi:hypothetical protein
MPNFGDQGHVDLVAGCVGDGDSDTIDLIVASNANGTSLGTCGGAAKFRAPPGPRDIQLTGDLGTGANCPPAHQDVMQIQSAGPRLDLVNVKAGDYAAGLSYTVGAGGAVFFSMQSDVDVIGGEYITCNHGHFGNSTASNTVVGAKFRTGRTDGTDPVCATSFPSDPCVGAAQFVDTVCERWNATLDIWESRPPRLMSVLERAALR